MSKSNVSRRMRGLACGTATLLLSAALFGCASQAERSEPAAPGRTERAATGKLYDGEPAVVATNTLQIVVPAGNPDGLTSLADLAALSADGGKVVVCAAQVPCGASAASVLESAGVTLVPASLEQNVTAVLTKVTAGEADAGLVYRTDVLKAGDAVEGVDFTESSEAVNAYPAAVLTDVTAPAVARAFVDFLVSREGQTLLAARGFALPSEAG